MFTFQSSSVEDEGKGVEREGITDKEAEDQLALIADRILKVCSVIRKPRLDLT